MTSFSDAGEGATIGFATARGRNWPTLRQFTVFLENRWATRRTCATICGNKNTYCSVIN